MSNKINYIELTDKKAKDSIITDEDTYMIIATWNGKNMEGKDRSDNFTEILFFKKKDFTKLTNGKRVTIKERLANYRND